MREIESKYHKLLLQSGCNFIGLVKDICSFITPPFFNHQVYYKPLKAYDY